MAEYSRDELLKMQQEAARRVNEMNQRARQAMERTTPHHTPPHFEPAPNGQGSAFSSPAAGRASRADPRSSDQRPGARPGMGGGRDGPFARMGSRPASSGPRPVRESSHTGSGPVPHEGRENNHSPRQPVSQHPSPSSERRPPGTEHASPSPAPGPMGIARFLNLRNIFRDTDSALILAVLLLLYTENDDPLLMMALVYIML